MASDNRASVGFADALAALGTHPSALVLAALEGGALRLSDLSSGVVALDETSLNAALRELDAGGFVSRRVESGPPLRVLYVLTERGAEIATALAKLVRWIAERR